MDDLISRQAAIDEVRSYYDECDEREESIEERIEQLPSVDVQPVRHGHWDWFGFNIECSKCGFAPQFDSTEPLYSYCPNCGSRMDEGSD